MNRVPGRKVEVQKRAGNSIFNYNIPKPKYVGKASLAQATVHS